MLIMAVRTMCCAAQGGTQTEWKEAHGSALLLGQWGADLEEQMKQSACMLVMEYIPGRPLLGEQEPFQAAHVLRTAEDLGRSVVACSISLSRPHVLPKECFCMCRDGNFEHLSLLH